MLDSIIKSIFNEELVILPTETVYGIACNAYCRNSIYKIFRIKKRPLSNPLTVHCLGMDHVRDDVMWTPIARKLAQHFWPGPLTIVLKRSLHCRVPVIASSGLDTVAVRAPCNEFFRKVLFLCDIPLVATSANISGKESPTCIDQIKDFELRNIPMIDDGVCRYGVESTVIECINDPTILRAGALSIEEIESVTGSFIKLAIK
jgi:L-threonylcarbamoyladenylate synthase